VLLALHHHGILHLQKLQLLLVVHQRGHLHPGVHADSGTSGPSTACRGCQHEARQDHAAGSGEARQALYGPQMRHAWSAEHRLRAGHHRVCSWPRAPGGFRISKQATGSACLSRLDSTGSVRGAGRQCAGAVSDGWILTDNGGGVAGGGQ
jgi:hypothetical protein